MTNAKRLALAPLSRTVAVLRVTWPGRSSAARVVRRALLVPFGGLVPEPQFTE